MRILPRFISICSMISTMTITAQTTVKTLSINSDLIPLENFKINKFQHSVFAEVLGECVYDGIWVGKESKIPNVDGIRKDFIDGCKEAGVTAIRWPGGCFADHYHWKYGVGPNRKSRIYKANLEDGEHVSKPETYSNEFGTNEFIELCRLVGCEPILVTNTATGIPADFLDWFEYCNGDTTTFYGSLRVKNGHPESYQVSNCAGKVTITDCEFGGLIDDLINVHGTSVKIIEKINDRKLKCRFMHEQSTGMIWGHVGDTIGYLENSSMQTLGKETLTGFEKLNRDEFLLEFSHAVPTEIVDGDALENLSWSPTLTVQNCKFNSCRARGLLVSTPGKVIINQNEFESSGSAILIAGDANGWYESGAVNDVSISNNIFKDACMTSVYQFCEGIISV